MSNINWAGVAQMIIVVVGVLWAATIVCLLWEIREALNYISLSTDAQFQMMDAIWTEISWMMQDLGSDQKQVDNWYIFVYTVSIKLTMQRDTYELQMGH